MHTFTGNPSTQEVKAGGSDVQGHPQLQKELKVTLFYIRDCLKKKKLPKSDGERTQTEGIKAKVRTVMAPGWESRKPDRTGAWGGHEGISGTPAMFRVLLLRMQQGLK